MELTDWMPESAMNNTQAELHDDALGEAVESVRAPAPRPSASRLENLARLNVAVEVLRTLPAEFVKRHRVLPLEIRRGVLHVATAEPGNPREIGRAHV